MVNNWPFRSSLEPFTSLSKPSKAMILYKLFSYLRLGLEDCLDVVVFRVSDS